MLATLRVSLQEMIVLYLELFVYNWVPAEKDKLVLTTFITLQDTTSLADS